ncbi:DUF418 domain-containing protein [Silvibacterium acidisoli]|uniref:DUF418 domain-containing protein n=1 Tax=Acidobacteriaceae bacterium ZG23-2 TaxID=2883246 RepID=UPI00406D11F8
MSTVLSAAPVSLKDRIESIDVLRGVALLGILSMNIQDFSSIAASYWNPTVFGDFHGLNFAIWYACMLFSELKFMSIFSMLFGAGILLMTSRIEASGRKPGPIHYRRMGWLMVFGLLHGYLLWTGDILFTYGFCGLFAYLARKWKPRKLLTVGMILVAVSTLLYVGSYITFPQWPKDSTADLVEHSWSPSPEAIQKELQTYRSGWRAEEPDRITQTTGSDIQGQIFLTFWRACGLMLVGMGLFKLGVFSAKLPARVYRQFIVIGLLVGIPIIVFGAWQKFHHHWEVRVGFFLDFQYNYWGSLFVSFFWIGLVMLICQKNWLSGLARRLAAVGRMAFTNYLTHTFICTFLFYGWGLGLFGKLDRVHQFGIVFAIWAFQLLFSPWWLARFRFGPFEWIWRSLTYWKLQPMRRAAVSA